MNRPFFYNDLDVISDDLNQIGSYSTGKATNILLASLNTAGGYGSSNSTSKGGILGSPADYLLPINFKVTSISGWPNMFTIHSGNALDSSGNLITISTDISLTYGQTTSTYSWAGVLNTTSYVKLKYQESSGSIKPDTVGNLYATRYISGYFITVDTNSTPASNEILLASFFINSYGNIVGAINDLRTYIRPNIPASSVWLNPYTKQAPASILSVEDHINSHGGSTPTLSNPHGLTLQDLGYNDTGLGVVMSHLINAHLNGILVLSPGLQAAWQSFSGSINHISGPDTLSFASPTGSVLMVNGSIVTSLTGILTSTDLYNALSHTDGSGWAVCDGSGSLSWKLDSDFTSDQLIITSTGLTRTNHNASQYYILGRATTSTIGDNFSAFVDHRSFYSDTPLDIAADPVELQLNPNLPIGTQYASSSLSTSLARLRYQIARSIGSGSTPSWNASTYPLTDGPSSNADNLHSHTFNGLTDVTAPLSLANLKVLTNGSGSNADNLHTHVLNHFVGSCFTADTTQSGSSVGYYYINWLPASGGSYHTYDYLNLIPGTGSTILTIPAGVYRIEGSYNMTQVTSVTVDVLELKLSIDSDNFILDSASIFPSTSPWLPCFSFATTFEIQSTQNIGLFVAGLYNFTYTGAVYGRLSITKLSGYPIT